MDSPNASGYVPLSLVDTLTRPNRSYRSHHASGSHSFSSSAALSTPAGGPSSSSSGTLTSSRSIHHAHSASLAALASKERSEQARREAAQIGEALGLSSSSAAAAAAARDAAPPETPVAAARRVYQVVEDATPKPTTAGTAAAEVATLRRQLADREQEVAALKREVAALNKDKKKLELERDEVHVATLHKGGLDAVQVEELVKQFNDQEALLGGYQREAEKSLAELDRLRNKERRLNDWFERMYGPGWADELNLTDKPSLSSSPAFRGAGIGAKHASSRPSLLTTPSSSSSLSSTSSSVLPSSTSAARRDSEHALDEQVATDDDAAPRSQSLFLSPDAVPAAPATTTTQRPLDPSLTPLALRRHLESVQALIRGMETRLIARGVELEAVEKRARHEARRAESSRTDFEALIASSSSSSSSAAVPAVRA